VKNSQSLARGRAVSGWLCWQKRDERPSEHVVTHNLEVSQERVCFLWWARKTTKGGGLGAQKCRLSWVCSQWLKQALCCNTCAEFSGLQLRWWGVNNAWLVLWH